MSDVILVDYRAGYAQLQADSKAIQAELKETEKVGVNAANNTTKAFGQTEEKAKSLKAQLRELKAQLANATDPKDIERLAKAAGKLTDQLEDASDAARVFASESKFEQIGNALGSVGSKLRNLDFKGAADQSKLLVSTTKSLTFKEALGGVKDLGSTLLNIGKSLILNPIFLIGTAIAVIIANFDKLKSSGGLIGTLFTGIGKAVSLVVDGFKNLSDAIGLTSLAAENQTKEMLDGLDKQIAAIAGYYDKRIALDNAYGRDSTENEKAKNRKTIIEANKGIQELIKIQQYHNEEYLKRDMKAGTSVRAQRLVAGRAFTEDEQKKFDELTKILNDSEANIEIISAKNATKKLAETKKTNKELIDEAKNLAKVLRDLQTGNLNLEYEVRKKRILDNFDDESAKYKGHNAILIELEIKKNRDLNDLAQERENKNRKIFEDAQVDYIKLFKDGAKDIEGADTALSEKVIKNISKVTEAEKKAAETKKQLYTEFYAFLNSAISATQQIAANVAETQLQDVKEKSDAESLELQNKYDKGIISKDEYEKKKATIDKRTADEEAKIKKRAFETNKQLALIQVVINTALAIAKTVSELGMPAAIPFIALAAANGALQIAAIESQPTPKFEKGGKVGGRRHSAGGTVIEAEVDEFVINRNDATKHDRLLTAINKGQAHNFIKDFYIAPALKAERRRYEEKKDRSFAENLVKSLSMNGGFKDENLLDSLKAVRQNDRQIAQYIVKELKGNQRSNHKW